MIVLPLSGDAEVTIGDTTFALAGRESVFTAVTDTAYLPINSQVRLSSPHGGTIALPGARADRALPFRFQPASQVDVSLRAAGSHTRQVNNFGMGAGMECVKTAGDRGADPGVQLVVLPAAQARRESAAPRPSWKRSTTTGSPRPPRPGRLPPVRPKPLATNGSTEPPNAPSKFSKRSPMATPY